MNNYKVYMHITPSGKCYIGVTKNDTKFRWKNGKSYKNCRRFNAAIKKYGWESIKHLILYQDLSQEDAYKKEKELIKKYKSNNPNFGYNISLGGNTVSDETKKLISEKTKLAMSRPEVKEKISISQRNRVSPLKGRNLTEEHKRKLSDSHKGKGKKHTISSIEKMRKNNTKKKSIVCVETGVIYESINEAGRQTHIDYRNIHRSCKTNKIAGGYHWEYKEREEK